MAFLRVIVPGSSPRELVVADGATVGEVLSAEGISASGRSVVLNGTAGDLNSRITGGENQVVLAAAVKGGC